MPLTGPIICSLWRGGVRVEILRYLLPLLELLRHHPIDELQRMRLDLRRRIGHDLTLKHALDAVGVDQIEDAAQADGLVEEAVAALRQA